MNLCLIEFLCYVSLRMVDWHCFHQGTSTNVSSVVADPVSLCIHVCVCVRFPQCQCEWSTDFTLTYQFARAVFLVVNLQRNGATAISEPKLQRQTSTTKNQQSKANKQQPPINIINNTNNSKNSNSSSGSSSNNNNNNSNSNSNSNSSSSSSIIITATKQQQQEL